MPFNVWQHNLVVYSQQVTDLVLGKHESHRQFFARLKDKVDPGQVSLLLGLDSLPLVFLFFAGWTAWLGSCVFSSRLGSCFLQAGQPGWAVVFFLAGWTAFCSCTGWTAFCSCTAQAGQPFFLLFTYKAGKSHSAGSDWLNFMEALVERMNEALLNQQRQQHQQQQEALLQQMQAVHWPLQQPAAMQPPMGPPLVIGAPATAMWQDQQAGQFSCAWQEPPTPGGASKAAGGPTNPGWPASCRPSTQPYSGCTSTRAKSSPSTRAKRSPA